MDLKFKVEAKSWSFNLFGWRGGVGRWASKQKTFTELIHKT